MSENVTQHAHDPIDHHTPHTPSGHAADHVAEARLRARQVLASESHLGDVDDWRRALVSARDSLIFIWITWLTLYGFGHPPFTGAMLLVLAIALAILFGISTARSTHAQVEYYTSELDRERSEIRDNFDHECEEVRVLYAAKGFEEPLLSQIVDTLTADDDRLLKLMMEEELGLSMNHINHPLIVGLWNFSGALLAGCALAVPVLFLSQPAIHQWMPVGGAALMAVVALISSRATSRSMIEFFTVGLIMAIVTGGVAYLLAQWLTQWTVFGLTGSPQ